MYNTYPIPTASLVTMELFEKPVTVSPKVLDQIHQKPTIDLPPTLQEVNEAIKQTSAGKAPWKRQHPC